MDRKGNCPRCGTKLTGISGAGTPKPVGWCDRCKVTIQL